MTEGDLAEERRRWRERQGLPEPEPSDTPAAYVLGEDLVRQVDPLVREIRKQVFGSPDPPFASVGSDDAARWNAGGLMRDVTGRPTAQDRRLREGMRELVHATGFREADVLTWIATGTPPPFRPFVARWYARKIILPDGTVLRRRFAVLEVHGPIAEKEFRRVWTAFQRLWRRGEIPAALTPPKRGRRITADDEAIVRLMNRMPEDTHTWKQRAAAWNEGRPSAEQVKADALRIRWDRLKRKRHVLSPVDVEPTPTTEE